MSSRASPRSEASPEFLEVAGMTQAAGLKLMAHSPYFGPGWLATLQLLAALPDPGFVERLFVGVEASLFGPLIDAVDGRFNLPRRAGARTRPRSRRDQDLPYLTSTPQG